MDEIERRIREANPYPIRRDDPLSKRAERELALLLSTQRHGSPPHVRRWRTPVLISTAAAVLALTFAVASSFLFTPQPALAAPPPLELMAITGTPDSVIEELIVRAHSLKSSSPTSIASETWSADISTDSEQTFVQPREIVRTRSADLSGTIVVTAGQVRWGNVQANEKPPSPGSVLQLQDFGHGDYPLLFTTPPPANPSEYRAYFSATAGTTETSTPGDFFRAITSLRNEWVFTGAQTAAVLEFIQGLPHVEVAGQVTDRLGRHGVAIATNSRSGGAFRDMLIFDRATGALLSTEQIYLGGLSGVPLKASTVLDYTAWKVVNEK
jgi:hypothetical protein